MTRRPSKRELETSVDDLRRDDPDTVYEWLKQYVIDRFKTGDTEVEPSYKSTPSVPDDEVVVYVATDGEPFSISSEDLPAWIESDDLPIHGTENRRNPFVIADFTDTDT